MDPISAAASVIGILTLAEAVLTSCYRFASQVNNAATDVDRIIHEVGSLKAVLLDLKGLVDGDGGSELNSLCGEDGALTACVKSLQELESKLAPAAGPMSLRRRLMWPLESKKVDEILENIRAQRPTLALALMGENLGTTRAIQVSLEQSQLREEREKILNWLCRTNPMIKHMASRELHQPGSNHWILESGAFEEWKRTPGHTLWLHGKPGAGKTIICSTIIDHMEGVCKTQSGTRLAYYYFDFNDENVLRLKTLLLSIIFQHSRQSQFLSDHVRLLYEHCDNGRGIPDDGLLASTLFDLLNEDQQTFIIIDALDECPKDERDRFFRLITQQIGQRPGRYNFLVTSRNEPDIEDAMTEITQLHNVPIQSGDVDADVRLHVHEFILSNRRLKNWSEELRTEIEAALGAGAQGMFRWAACQLDLIKNYVQAGAVRKALKNLPKTLEETYDRILQTIPEDSRGIARAALVLLAYSFRPLTLQELAEAMVVDVEEQCFDPKEHRLNDDRDVLEICSSLVTVSKVKNDHRSEWMREKNAIERKYGHYQEFEVIQLAHFSVKEYMVLPSSKVDSRPPPFYISNEIAHQHIAESSLIYLIDFSRGARVDLFDFNAFPFLAYAARYWYEHWRHQLSSVDQARVNELMRRLFSSSEPNAYINFLNICQPDALVDQTFALMSFHYNNFKSLDAFPSPLYYTAQLGHYELCEWLIEDEGCDIDLAKGTFGTPLHIAARFGHARIVKLLLDKGADVNALHGKYENALQAASFAGHERVVRMLLDHGANVNTQGGKFGSALIAACHESHIVTAKVLLDAGADINIISKYQGKALNISAATGNTALVRLLLQRGADINDTNGGVGSALYAAAEAGHLDMVKMLINAGANVNLVSGDNCTALQAACSTRDQTEHNNSRHKVVKFLLKSGADCNIRGGNYGDALQACVEAGNIHSTLETLHLLLDHGASVDYQGGIYHSAMRASVFTGNVEAAHVLLDRGAPIDDEIFLQAIENSRSSIIPRLLEKGVNVNAQNKVGTALQIAIEKEDRDTTMALLRDPSIDLDAKGGEHGATALYCAIINKNREMTSLLLDRGADINADGGSYGHCLCGAAYFCDEEMVYFLLEKGADVNAQGLYGTPLILAIEKSRDNVVKLLVSRGADVNARGRGGSDPLQTAAYKGNEPLVKLLLDCGADIKAPEGDNGSCLECAICSGNASLVHFLISKGVKINYSLGDIENKEKHGMGGALFTAIRTRQKEFVPMLIDFGADINAIGEIFYGTPLQTAIHWNDEQSVNILLNNDVDVNKIGGHNGCALTEAILTRDMAPTVQLLLDADANVNLQAGVYGCPLAAAVHMSNLPLVEQLLDLGADINAPAGRYGSILRLSVIEGDFDVFRLLLTRGANPNVEYGDYGTALTAAAMCKVTMLNELLEYGADLTLGDSQALVAAAAAGNDSAVEILLEKGREVYEKEGIPGRPLIMAAKKGLVRICKGFLDKGVNVNAIGGEYGNALLAILSDSHTSNPNLVTPTVTLLLSHGADVNLPPSEHYTSALQAALSMHHMHIVDTLLDAGADVNANDSRFGTALTAAANLRDEVWVRKLLEKGADPALSGGKFGTPLQAAAYCHRIPALSLLLAYPNTNPNQFSPDSEYGYALHAACSSEEAIPTISLLLDHGADINARGGKYETALQCASKHGHLETVRWLVEKGADVGVRGGECGSAMEAAVKEKQWQVVNFLRRYGEGRDVA